MILRTASPAELPALSDLCLRSKGYWGYDVAFLEACRQELTLCPDDLDDTSIAVAQRDGMPLGLAQVKIENGVCDLLKLFVEPAEIGQGCGTILLAWAIAEARRHGATLMTIEADPGAVPFYCNRGACVVGTAPSGSIAGRDLPLLHLPLTGREAGARANKVNLPLNSGSASLP